MAEPVSLTEVKRQDKTEVKRQDKEEALRAQLKDAYSDPKNQAELKQLDDMLAKDGLPTTPKEK